MVRLDEPLSAETLEPFLEEVQGALSDLQPELNARIYDGRVIVGGQLICTGSEGPFDDFDVLIAIEEGFPVVEPTVWEMRERIPKKACRHVFPGSGTCCICIWEEWLWEIGEPSFREYLAGPLHSYFVSQSIYEMTGRWPFGERAHDKAGLIQAYARMLGLDESSNVERYVHLLAQNKLKGHQRCPCGSGRRVRDCHLDEIMGLRERIARALAKRMDRRLQRYRRS